MAAGRAEREPPDAARQLARVAYQVVKATGGVLGPPSSCSHLRPPEVSRDTITIYRQRTSGSDR
jgi:hypothetical protein